MLVIDVNQPNEAVAYTVFCVVAAVAACRRNNRIVHDVTVALLAVIATSSRLTYNLLRKSVKLPQKANAVIVLLL